MEHPIPGRFRLCASAVVVKPLALVDRLFLRHAKQDLVHDPRQNYNADHNEYDF